MLGSFDICQLDALHSVDHSNCLVIVIELSDCGIVGRVELVLEKLEAVVIDVDYQHRLGPVIYGELAHRVRISIGQVFQPDKLVADNFCQLLNLLLRHRLLEVLGELGGDVLKGWDFHGSVLRQLALTGLCSRYCFGSITLVGV